MPPSSSLMNCRKSATVCEMGLRVNSQLSRREGKGTVTTGNPSRYCTVTSETASSFLVKLHISFASNPNQSYLQGYWGLVACAHGFVPVWPEQKIMVGYRRHWNYGPLCWRPKSYWSMFSLLRLGSVRTQFYMLHPLLWILCYLYLPSRFVQLHSPQSSLTAV